ncbi:zeta toxin family protein [Streptomyces sp. WZ-12]|uniref:zeta toxin family protein n=1 Tax=Streptomyces sp. WZ-12 TaxID=3030210 RepID=UPI00238181A5|nr:zeta toxin family protein [Streptomyces sp. WZ-12]
MVADLVQAALNRRGGAVRVDHDEYKAMHPHYQDYLSEDVRTAGSGCGPRRTGGRRTSRLSIPSNCGDLLSDQLQGGVGAMVVLVVDRTLIPTHAV